MEKLRFRKLCVLFFWIICYDISLCDVEQLNSSDFDKFIAENNHCIILFKTSEECPCCSKALKYLGQIPQPDGIQTKIQRRYVIDEDLAEKYMATDYPGIVYFRNQRPVLYTEKLQSSDDLMPFADWLEKASEIPLIALHDSTFEHLTQAATGATTGDWFVLFYLPESPEHEKILPSFESAAIKFKHRMNFALVDADTNKNVVKRFDVGKTPHIILFKQGKMYRYEPEKYDTASFIAFIEGWYRNVKMEIVPREPTAFDKLTESIALFIKERMDDPNRRWQVLTAGAFAIIGVIMLLFLTLFFKRKDSRSKAD